MQIRTGPFVAFASWKVRVAYGRTPCPPPMRQGRTWSPPVRKLAAALRLVLAQAVAGVTPPSLLPRVRMTCIAIAPTISAKPITSERGSV